MAKDIIRYDLLVQDAMRGVMRKVLGDVAESGYLPGDHHFTISFRTDAPGVTISRRLAEQWPSELTIILQHQWSNLEVDEEGFGVTLSFRSVPEHLYVPYAAVTGFFDPAVEFGLRFESAEDALEDSDDEDAPFPGPSLVAKTPEPAKPFKPAKVEPVKSEPAKVEPNKTPGADRQKKLKPVEAKEEGDDKIVSIDAFRKKP
ncbi:SspB family protein [Methylocystis suflitae]|uniref:SspB family protein n=1 Tax=Methylocystis suflitae TaxID=2951405 RepID=UPI00210C4077|nr:ClpXP protease specificity-enhancing factor SspB [Methylocystis suflitae]MCQ4189372.1 ClpXP protease specificity-enhancing factor SspB [Methylocystis suflitae]